ncbi:MAG TPA: restriction endonuclease subunit S [Nitrospira sp.]|nr:restriction endonuclease subunit S [Nitrospira sp.]
MKTVVLRVTETGGRDATTRYIPPKLALAVGMPATLAPKDWRWTPLTELARLESGHTPSRKHPEYWGGTLPWIGIQDAKTNHGRCIEDTQEKTNELGIENSSARILPENTVCLSRTASVGYVVVMGHPMATSQDFVNWVCSKYLDHNFLKYLFIAEGEELLRFASGAVHQTIYFPEAKAFHICHPALPEQQRIVGILDEAFDGLAIATANAEQNLRNVRALFESHLQSVFTQRGKGWVEKPLWKLCTFSSGGTPSKTNRSYWAGTIPWVSGRDMKTTRLSDTALHISQRAVDESSTRMAPAGSLLTLVRGMGLAHGAQISELMVSCAFNQDIRAIQPEQNVVPRFLLFALRTRINHGENVLSNAAHGTLKIDMDELRNVEVPIPIPEEQRRIVRTIDDLSSETQRLESIYQQKLAALSELKKSLLRQAFSGQL